MIDICIQKTIQDDCTVHDVVVGGSVILPAHNASEAGALADKIAEAIKLHTDEQVQVLTA